MKKKMKNKNKKLWKDRHIEGGTGEKPGGKRRAK